METQIILLGIIVGLILIFLIVLWMLLARLDNSERDIVNLTRKHGVNREFLLELTLKHNDLCRNTEKELNKLITTTSSTKDVVYKLTELTKGINSDLNRLTKDTNRDIVISNDNIIKLSSRSVEHTNDIKSIHNRINKSNRSIGERLDKLERQVELLSGIAIYTVTIENIIDEDDKELIELKKLSGK